MCQIYGTEVVATKWCEKSQRWGTASCIQHWNTANILLWNTL